MSTSLHERLQLDLFARLLADSFFDTIQVVLVRPRSRGAFTQIYEEIDQSLGGIKKKANKAGASVQVLMAVSNQLDPNVMGPRLAISLTVRCQEIVPINMGASGTLKTVEEIAERVIQLGHQFAPVPGNALVFNDATPSDAFDPKITVDVTFAVQSGLTSLAKVATPVLSLASGVTPQTVTITCATSGAAILYSLDGTYPTLPYTVPISVSTAATLRAIAGKSGSVQSNIAQGIFT